tara:strand:+ start:113 stop:700 length:588 start_codon:yes stop_codon:yes gene_type:complete
MPDEESKSINGWQIFLGLSGLGGLMYLLYSSDDDEEGVSGVDGRKFLWRRRRSGYEFEDEGPDLDAQADAAFYAAEDARIDELEYRYKDLTELVEVAIDESEELKRRPGKRNLFISKIISACHAEVDNFGYDDDQYRDYEHCAEGEVANLEEWVKKPWFWRHKLYDPNATESISDEAFVKSFDPEEEEEEEEDTE